ncbi:MAG TPA: TolC family protein, partial [Vicinamibacteria bacterium]
MRPRPISVLLAFTVLSAAARGAEPPATELPLTLAEALERARTASPRLAELRALEEASAAAARGAKADRGPLLGLSAAYSRNSNVPEFSVTQIDGSELLVFPNLPNQGYLRANLGQPLYTGGRVKGALESAEAQQIAAGKDKLAGQSDLRLEVTAAFWRLVGRRESERVLREAIASYESHLKDTTNLLEVGMAARNDVLAVQVERDRAELARLEAESGAEIENANLVRLMNLPADTLVRPIEEGGAANEAGPSGNGAGPALNETGGQIG